jgi:hypothetical protein
VCHTHPHCAPDRHPDALTFALTFAHSEPDGFSHGRADVHGLPEPDTDAHADPCGGSCPAIVR